MKNDVALKVQDIHKSFKLPHEQHSGIKQLIVNILKRKHGYETQHVLNDINFEVKKGEFFGIVGRNGSGKSTLLKLIAGIYSPDKGAVIVNGSLTPFIELGVGFNPELTGRENVFLNGALLGFNRDEMERMYDEIVDFAELERFMDQKLKNYSSGMQVRLAFSIAIRAKSDILVLDEVLAVGDEAFQRKCDVYFQSIKDDNTKTIILVTHSMGTVKRYCDRAIMISEGRIVASGTPDDVTNKYTEENFGSAGSKIDNKNDNLGLSSKISSLRIVPKSKQVLRAGEDIEFEIEYKITDDTPVHIAISIKEEIRNCVVMANRSEAISGKGIHKLTYRFPTNIYNDSDLSISAVVDEKDTLNRIAFTNEMSSCRFSIRNEYIFSSLIAPFGEVHGEWVGDTGEFLVDSNGRKVR